MTPRHEILAELSCARSAASVDAIALRYAGEDAIGSGGENLHPAELEGTIFDHPDVATWR